MYPRISVAMATYNGQKYLLEQLDSLASQTRLPCELIVGDDGSDDATVAILEDFSRTAPFPVRITVNSRRLGYADNFLAAAARCEGDWIAFCDQDDVWLPEKLADSAAAIARYPGAMLILQNAELCGPDLTRTGRCFPNKIAPGFYGPNAQYGFWVWLGCLQTFNAKLIRSIPFHNRPPNYFQADGKQSHDKWTCMLANASGGVVVLKGIKALYRRHPDAQTGTYSRQTSRQRVRLATSTTAKSYDYLRTVATKTSDELRHIAHVITDREMSCRLEESARMFDGIALIYKARSDLYQREAIWNRAAAYLRIWTNGGYIGPRFRAIGILSAAKDGVVTVSRSILRKAGT